MQKIIKEANNPKFEIFVSDGDKIDMWFSHHVNKTIEDVLLNVEDNFNADKTLFEIDFSK